MKSLYSVTLKFATVVYAEDEEQAEATAKDFKRLITENDASVILCNGRLDKVSHGWHNSIPWGEKSDRTCDEILKEEK